MLLSLGVAALLIASTLPTHLPNQSREDDARVVGGRRVKSCQWPSAMLMDMGFFTCSSTLVHPQIVITAAHCLKGRKFTVYSGDGNTGEDKQTLKEREVEYCRKHPKFNGTSKTPTLDFGYCKLKEPVTDIAPMPIMMGCEVDLLKESSDLDVTVVGFGYIDPRDKSKIGTKYEVDTKFQGIDRGLAKVGLTGKGPLQGDSGGPVYVKLPEGEFNKDAGWRVFGITSTSRGSSSPDGRAYYGMMHTFVEFLEEDSGIDVTPCTNAQGEWEPTKDCKGAFSDPYEASGDWINGCEPSPPGGYISSCGKPFAGADEKAPQLSITSPKDGQRFEPGTTSIEVKVEASDDGEIEKLLLMLDGNAQTVDNKAPYKWTLRNLAPGSHELVATAVDQAGNEGASQPVGFEIEASGDDDAKSKAPSKDKPEDSDKNEPSDDEASKDSKGKSDNDQDSNASEDDSPGVGPGGCLVVGATTLPWGTMGLLGVLFGLNRRRQGRRASSF